MKMRKALEADFPAIWEIFHAVVKEGDTYMYAPETSYEEAKRVWMGEGIHTYACIDNDNIIGTYIIKSNQPDLGSHVCNASFMVHPHHHGKGAGKGMAQHALEEAKCLEYTAMQFNCVIATNLPAIQLWGKMGFTTIGTVPKAYQHQKLGLVDIVIMHKSLIK